MKQANGPAGQRRRGSELEAALLDAAWQELAAVGYKELTMDGVAARAHTGKQVLYRRWRNRAELVLAALRHRTGSIVADPPDTGSLRGDVLEILRRMTQRFRDLGPDTIHGLMTEAADVDPDFRRPMTEAMLAVLARAAARGEIASAAITTRVAMLPTDLLRHDMLFARNPVPDDALAEIVDDIYLPLVHIAANPRPRADE